MAGDGGMHPKALTGLKRWAKNLGHGDIADSLMDHGKDEDSAHRIATWLKKKARGEGTTKKGGCSGD